MSLLRQFHILASSIKIYPMQRIISGESYPDCAHQPAENQPLAISRVHPEEHPETYKLLKTIKLSVMRCKRRKFHYGEPQHIYQRTIGGVNIFYDLEDYLVYYTIFSTSSKKFGISVLALCLMIDHVHYLIEAENKKSMSDFICYFTSIFVREYNRGIGRSGPLFEKAYGNAPKKGEKKIRTTILYIFNNPVEKNLCSRAEEYKWNFLAYIRSKNPFSVYSNKRNTSKALKSAMDEVARCYNQGLHLKYAQLRRMFRKLSNADKDRLTDYIITTYSSFDHDTLLNFYGNWDTMVYAANSATGSEYDVKETYYSHSDEAYHHMIGYLQKYKGMETIRKVTLLSPEEKHSIAKEFQRDIHASNLQIQKFLHL